MANPPTSQQKLPLEGLRVVEYGTGVAGQHGAKLLGDSGAEVIKVEPPDGDELRRQAYSFAEEEAHSQEGLFQFLNTNKQGVTLNVKNPEGRRLLDLLLGEADIFMWSGPAALARSLRLHYRHLRKTNPRLIVTSVTPFGLTGPYRNFKGDEFIVYNLGGLGYASPGMPDKVDDPPNEPPLHPRTPVADFITGSMAAVATMIGVFVRDQDGQGRHVDISGMEAVASMLLRDAGIYSYVHLVTGRLPIPVAMMPNAVMPCKDGFAVIATPYGNAWERLVTAMGEPEWATLEVFRDPYLRSMNWDALRPLMEEWTKSRTREEINNLAQAHSLPCFGAFTVGEMMGSAQMLERAFFWHVPVDGEKMVIPGELFKMSETPLSLRSPAPSLGQHNLEVLGPLGLSQSDIEHLRLRGVV